VASDKTKPHDGGFFRTLLPILLGRADFIRHTIAPYWDKPHVGEELFRTLGNEIQLPQAELLGSSKKALEERGTNSSAGVPWFDNYGSDKATKPSDLQCDDSDDSIVL
jgi:hypothetical protein